MDMSSLPFPILFLAAIALFRTLEFLDGSRAVSPSWRGEAFRLGVHASLYALAIALSFRPVLALVLSVCGLAGVLVANRVKKRVVFEPIVFSDLALLGQIIRHPHLYFISRGALIAGAALLIVGVLGLSLLEPARFDLLWLPLVFIAGWLIVWINRKGVVAAFKPDVLDVASGWGSRPLGLASALVLQVLGWIVAPSRAEQVTAKDLPVESDLVVIQLESFVDMPSRLRGASSPFWQDLKARSLAHGPLQVSSKGANTMRTEHAVLSGMANSALGYDRFDPYLRPALGKALPAMLDRSGWSTTFLHPNDLRFFRRDRVLPQLGFNRLVGESDFVEPSRIGRYVSDAALVERLIAELNAAAAPAFVFAVTMENHGPWKVGRLPGVEPGLASYLAHLANMEAALATLIEHLQQRPRRTLLVLYGDHLPALSEVAGWDDHDTDYLILDCHRRGPDAPPTPLTPERLLDTAMALL